MWYWVGGGLRVEARGTARVWGVRVWVRRGDWIKVRVRARVLGWV